MAVSSGPAAQAVPYDVAQAVLQQELAAFSHWATDFLATIEQQRVYPTTQPGTVAAALPAHPPQQGEAFAAIRADFERLIVPNLTHWNHPRNHAYFNSSASIPGILGELAMAVLNNQGMLWHSGQAATELETVTLDWLRQLLGLPSDHWGIIYDTASIGVLHAIAAARERAFPDVRQRGPAGFGGKRPRIYCSEMAHSSVDKACIGLGLGLDSLRKIAVDEAFCMRPAALEAAIQEDMTSGWAPFCVVSTAGTTSSTSIDPIAAVQAICHRHKLWHHVDAAHGGSMAIVPAWRHLFAGWEQADSIVYNPHKWLFVPMDCSVLYTRHREVLRQAFSLVAEYLITPQHSVTNYMDYGLQLGRRFRSLKLWFVLRAFGQQGLAAIIQDHVASAQWFARQVQASQDWQLLAPVPMSTVCFRAVWPDVDAAETDRRNEVLIQRVNQAGQMFVSHTKLPVNGVPTYTLRMVVSHLNTRLHHVQQAWADWNRHRAGMNK